MRREHQILLMSMKGMFLYNIATFMHGFANHLTNFLDQAELAMLHVGRGPYNIIGTHRKYKWD